MTITRTETTHQKAFGHSTWTLVETNDRGATLRTSDEIVARFEDGVEVVRHIVTSNGFPPTSDSQADVRLRLDPERADLPSPIEHREVNALLTAHIPDLVAASDRLGYIGDRDQRLAFLARTRGHGCLPVRP